MNSTIIEKHITIDERHQGNVVDCLAGETTLSKQKIKSAMKKGAVWLTKGTKTRRLRRAKKDLSKNDQLHLYYNEIILDHIPELPVKIADEIGYSIWFKPYGVYCQGSKWGDHCTINRIIEQNDERPAIIVHRLDRATTGLIIIAHKKSIAVEFSHYFQQRTLEKRYHAIVHGHFPPSEDIITIRSDIDSKNALSHFRLIKHDEIRNISEIEVSIETGRKHQIRKHLSEQGHPIVGDRLYGIEESYSKNLQLCSSYLSFNCPLTNTLKTYQIDPAMRPSL